MRKIKITIYDTFNDVIYHSDKYKDMNTFFEMLQQLKDGGNNLIVVKQTIED